MRLVTVVELPEFVRRAKAIMSDEERVALVNRLAANPAEGVSLGGGLRKLRVARPGGGKSGGYRMVHYVAPEGEGPVYLLTAYAKNHKANLSPSELEGLRALCRILDESERRRS